MLDVELRRDTIVIYQDYFEVVISRLFSRLREWPFESFKKTFQFQGVGGGLDREFSFKILFSGPFAFVNVHRDCLVRESFLEN